MFSRGIFTMVIAALGLVQLASAGPIVPRSAPAPLSGPGVSYSPYKGAAGSSACKTAEEVAADMAILKTKGVGLIRLYGLDCDQVKKVMKATSIPLFVGIFEVDALSSQIDLLAATVGNSWTQIHTVSIGNEFVLSGRKSADQMVALTREARTLLRGKGYQGPVVSVNVFIELINNPTLCQEQDYIACNAHAFFDGNVKAENAGEFVSRMRDQVSAKCGGKYVLISESGWPSQGLPNRAAVPSKANQGAAIASIKAAVGNNVILFTAFDDTWKSDRPETFNAEKYWGIY